MNVDLKSAFTYIKPLCDKVMACPSPKTLKALADRVDEINLTTLQEMQLYVLFPIVTHLRSNEITLVFLFLLVVYSRYLFNDP